MQQPPTIEFPCEYPIKVIGIASTEFRQSVVRILKSFDGRLSDQAIAVQPSAKGKYESIKVTLTATSESMLVNLFAELKTLPDLKMVL
jgi:putative lipoic acid-binding regulatory protein